MSLKSSEKIVYKTVSKKSTRAFLNKDAQSTALVSSYFEVEQTTNTKTNKKSISIESQLTIKDCSRQATLDFSNYGNSIQQLKFKVDKVQKALDLIKEGISIYEKEKEKIK